MPPFSLCLSAWFIHCLLACPVFAGQCVAFHPSRLKDNPMRFFKPPIELVADVFATIPDSLRLRP
jgi:hypothetical protein